ncbi:MAG TPA: hypothetical protein VG168_14935 [Bryobacteraceae bacterium]|nr:hypothetical protein [Bryobacteraceae bacterium]
MSINRVTLAGFTGKDARSSSTQNGRSTTKLSVATISATKTPNSNGKRRLNGTGVAYAGTAEYSAFRPERTSSSKAS